MTIELFIAALFFAVGCSLVTYVLLRRHIRKSGATREFDMTDVESQIASLLADLEHVANSHEHAVEDRKNELKRVIELANQQMRRMSSLLADMDIIEKRLRSGAAATSDTMVFDRENESSVSVSPPFETAPGFSAPDRRAAERGYEQSRAERRDGLESASDSRRPSEPRRPAEARPPSESRRRPAELRPSERNPAAPSREERNREIQHDLRRSSVPQSQPARLGRLRARRELYEEVRELADEGLSPVSIASQLKMPVSEVEMVLKR